VENFRRREVKRLVYKISLVKVEFNIERTRTSAEKFPPGDVCVGGGVIEYED